MLHIILGILKIIAIILGILAGLVLLVLLSLLLVPLRYQGKLQKDSRGIRGYGKITWLAHALSVRVLYEEGASGIRISLFGIPVERLKGAAVRLGRLRPGRKKTGPEGESQLKAAQTEDKLPDKAEVIQQEESEEGTAQRGKSVEEALEERPVSRKKKPKHKIAVLLEKIRAILYKIIHLPEKLLERVKNIYSTAGEIYGKIKVFLELIKSEEFLGARTLVWGQLRTLLRRLGPTKIKGTLSYGFDDPALTGQVLAGLSLFYPRYGGKLNVYPYFDRKILETDLYIRGRIYGVHLLIAAWKMYRDSNVKYMIKRFKHKEE